MVVDSSCWAKNLHHLLQVEVILVLFHLVHEEVVSLLKVFTKSTALLLRPVAGRVVDLFQNHPEFSSML